MLVETRDIWGFGVREAFVDLWVDRNSAKSIEMSKQAPCAALYDNYPINTDRHSLNGGQEINPSLAFVIRWPSR